MKDGNQWLRTMGIKKEDDRMGEQLTARTAAERTGLLTGGDPHPGRTMPPPPGDPLPHAEPLKDPLEGVLQSLPLLLP